MFTSIISTHHSITHAFDRLFTFLEGMNVIMPTAMVTMHQSDELSESSARTSERGIRIVKALIQFENEENKAENSNSVKSNVQAILKVANRKTTNDVLVKEEAAEYSNKLIKVSDSVLSLWPYANNAEMESDHAIDSIFDPISTQLCLSMTTYCTLVLGRVF